MKEPTAEECSNKSKVAEDDTTISYACWYPQMGGYVGKCVATFDKHWRVYKNGSAIGGCIELDVWHNGEFPFSESEGNPAHLHICDSEQFIDFGKFLRKMNNKNREVR